MAFQPSSDWGPTDPVHYQAWVKANLNRTADLNSKYQINPAFIPDTTYPTTMTVPNSNKCPNCKGELQSWLNKHSHQVWRLVRSVRKPLFHFVYCLQVGNVHQCQKRVTTLRSFSESFKVIYIYNIYPTYTVYIIHKPYIIIFCYSPTNDFSFCLLRLIVQSFFVYCNWTHLQMCVFSLIASLSGFYSMYITV